MRVKILKFNCFTIKRAQRKIARLVNQGWRIVGSGGAGSFPLYFVVLQLDALAAASAGESGARGPASPA
jgi:hypothetical protein